MGAILGSLIFSFITSSQELLLYRHLPYIMEPLGIMAGLGFVKLFDILVTKGDSSSILNEPNPEYLNLKFEQQENKPSKSPMAAKIEVEKSSYDPSQIARFSISSKINIKHKMAASSFIFIIIVLCGIFAYPPLEVVSGFEEGTTHEELDSCIWIRENLPTSSTVASDHRMSSMVFGIGMRNATWEYAPKTFHEDSMEEIIHELEGTNIPAGKKRIDFILLSKAIEKGVALKQWETAQPMSKEAIKKFGSEPFLKIFDNGDVRIYYHLDMESYQDQFSSG
jgi:hypothetical protein